VENRLVGMKSRGVYETPGGTLLYTAIKDLESITIDRRAEGLKDEIAQRWADMLYEGRWWTPEREAMQAMSDVLSKNVTGSVKLKLYKGACNVASRTSPVSLYREDLASFGHAATYDHADAAGFIRLFGLPIRAAAGLAQQEQSDRPSPEKVEAGKDAVSKLIDEVVEAGAL